MNKTIQAKHIPDADMLTAIAAIQKRKGMWASRWDLEEAFPDVPGKVLQAKCRGLINRDLATGCACGCRGDYEVMSDSSS